MLEKTVDARLCSLGTLAKVENMNLWAVTLQVGAMYQILTVLWSVKPSGQSSGPPVKKWVVAMWRDRREMMGLEQGNNYNVGGHGMKGGNRSTLLKEQGRNGSTNDRLLLGYFVFTFQIT